MNIDMSFYLPPRRTCMVSNIPSLFFDRFRTASTTLAAAHIISSMYLFKTERGDDKLWIAAILYIPKYHGNEERALNWSFTYLRWSLTNRLLHKSAFQSAKKIKA